MPKVTDPALLAQLNGQQPPGPQPIVLGRPDPKLPGQLRGQDLSNQRTAQQISIDAVMLPAELAKARAQAATAKAEIEKTRIEAQRLKAEQARGGLTADQASAQRDKLTALRALEKQIRTVGDLYRKGPGATSGLSGLLDYLPLEANKAFDTASAGIGDVAFNAFRTPGAGAQSDAELRARLAATQPSSRDYNQEVEQKIGYLQNRLAEEYRARGMSYKPVMFGSAGRSAPKKPADDGWKIEEVK